MKPVFFFFLLLTITDPLVAQTGKFEYIDVFNLEYVSDPGISPDGSKIVYVRNFKDVMTDKSHSNLWIINFDGTDNRPLTTGNRNDFAPRWSPDGTRILYKSNKEEDVQLYLRWLDTGSEAKITNFPHSPQSFQWSRDGNYIAFTMFVPKKKDPFASLPAKPEGASWNDPPMYIDELNYRGDGSGYRKEGNIQLFTLPVDGGTPRQVTFGDDDLGGIEWGPEGKAVFFTANLHENGDYDPRNTEIYRVDLESLSVMPVTDRHGPDEGVRVSPDGRSLAYLGFDDHYKGYQLTRLYVSDISGNDPWLLSPDLDRSIRQLRWAGDGKGIYFLYDDEGNTHIGYINLDGEISTVATDVGGTSLGRPYPSGSYSVSGNDRLAYTYTTPSHPADLMVTGKNGSQRLTRLNDDLFDYKELGEVEEFWYESSYDERKIQGWICKPPGFDQDKKYPLVLEIHGGPFANYGSRFSVEMQLYAAAGYVVLYTNPRGSTSYGEEFGNLIHHNYPSEDYDDLISGVDAVIEKGYIDENNLFVTGGSGGGVLSAWIVGKTNRFNAAVVAKPVINWFSLGLYTDIPAYLTLYWFDKYPWEDPEPYFRRSPISLVGNVETPTMILTGEEDYRTPIAESEQYYSALKLRKVESALVRIPGASHGIAAKPSNLIAKVVYIVEWFERHRKGK